MSFYGKKYKKTKFENIDEVMEAFKTPEKVRGLMKSTDNTTHFVKNDDGTISYIVSEDGQEKMNQKMTPGVESEFTTPNGVKAKVNCQVTDNSMEVLMTFPDGVKLHMDRVFEGKTMKNIIWREDIIDLKGVIYYEEV